ncbi:MAG: hypothetical protein JXB49_02830 [Bacteroidales bacterium]|nr:hypothetical protein [Bacteroidales bacterium]
MNKTIIQVETEMSSIIRDNPCLADRVKALEAAGYRDIVYVYVKNKRINNKGGIGSIFYLPRRKMYRIQIDNTELKKNYPAAWCLNIPETDIILENKELPF